LGIETATATCGTAVADSGGVISEAAIDSGLSHSSRLMELVGRVLRDASIDLAGLDAIAVSVGPGSFTGIRIGMGVAVGLAAGAGLPLAPVPTLDALARNQVPFEGLICPFVDARREEVYFSIYECEGRALKRIQNYSVRAPAGMAECLIDEMAGSGEGRDALLAGPRGLLDGTGIETAAPGRVLFAPPSKSAPGPGPVAEHGVELCLSAGSVEPGKISPIYVRRSDAELGQKKRRRPRGPWAGGMR
jgi:tRNA threonylcarbamoyladenosine biosynthesis protein TsaB